MPTKILEIEGVGPVKFVKNRRSKSLRIHIRGNEVKVTLPWYASFSQARAYTVSRKKWILDNLQRIEPLAEGSYIGKQHVINVRRNAAALRMQVRGKQIIANLPAGYDLLSAEVQAKLQRSAQKACKIECQELITPLLNDISLQNNLPFNSVEYKSLKSRWGSCDQDNNLVINSYLIQVPWPEINYVLAHELAHTKHHNHSRNFWDLVEQICPNYKRARKNLKQYHPNIIET